MLKYLILLPLFIGYTFSQGIYIPLEFEAAYEEGSRSLDGRPGPEYWQNKSDYKMNVTLYPETGYVKARLTLLTIIIPLMSLTGWSSGFIPTFLKKAR